MKNKKNISKFVQCATIAVIIFWAYSFFIAYLVTEHTSNFYKCIEGLIVLFAFVNAVIVKRWWQRVVWITIALLFAISLIYWIGWDMNSNIRF